MEGEVDLWAQQNFADWRKWVSLVNEVGEWEAANVSVPGPDPVIIASSTEVLHPSSNPWMEYMTSTSIFEGSVAADGTVWQHATYVTKHSYDEGSGSEVLEIFRDFINFS